MPTESGKTELSERDLREIVGYAADCARRALSIFEQNLPADTRPRNAIDAARYDLVSPPVIGPRVD